MNIGIISYSVSAFAFALFLVVLLSDRHRGETKQVLLIAASISGIWSLVLAYQSLMEIDHVQALTFDYFKNVIWLVLLIKLLSTAYDGSLKKSAVKKLQAGFLIAVFVLILPILSGYVIEGFSFEQDEKYLTVLSLFMAVLGVVFVEQLYRNTRAERKWAIRYLCFGLLGMYIYDFYMYADALLYQRIDPVLWQARGFVYVFTVPLILLSISRDSLWSPDIFISRRVVFHSTALLSSGVYLLVMAIGGYYVRDFGGNWGLVAQAVFLFTAILLLALFVTSRRLRARLSIFVNKHFYPYKYDYRDEWLRFIRTIAASSEEKKLYRNTIKSIAQIIESPGGLLWLRQENGFFVCVDSWEMQKVPVREPTEAALPKFIVEHEFIISVDEFQEKPEVYRRLGHLELPEWVKVLQPWLIVPLIYHGSLTGFVVLKHAIVRNKSFNWEDRDLLKTVARQIATFLETMRASDALAEARQFERFNKTSTYVLHDIKNLAAQLSLITSNAEKHKDNPLFMEDVFKTISNSALKMNKMMEVLNAKVATTQPGKTDIISILHELIKSRQASGAKPVPSLNCESKSFFVKAEKSQLFAILGHLIQNAQDATHDNGSIQLVQKSTSAGLEVEIQDTGMGMSDEFIKNQLFKPFSTTKGEKGMGIGVYEAREIMLAIGGQIEVSSTVNVGTCFKLTLPVAT